MEDDDLIRLALLIAHIGAFQDYRSSPSGRGIRLREHDRDPHTSLSPCYFNLRTPENPKPGPLTPDILQLMGKKLAELPQQHGLSYDAIAGIPNAGNPIAEAMLAFLPSERPPVQLQLVKRPIGVAGKTHRFELEETSLLVGSRVLLIDDVASTAGSKHEAAEVLRRKGYLVEDCLVVIDRRRATIRDEPIGLDIFSLFDLKRLILLYCKFGVLKDPKVIAAITTYADS